MKFINLTPHKINVIGGTSSREFPPSGTVARCGQIRQCESYLEGVAIFTCAFGPVEGLPEPAPRTLYIVSSLVRQAEPNRTDLLSPAELIRDEDGNVIGCKGFDTN